MRNPHDRLFKKALRRPDLAGDELRAVLPTRLVERLDLSRLEVCPTGFVNEELDEVFSDVVYRVPLAGVTAYVCALLEHQSTTDAWMGFRIFRYMARVWDDILGAEADRRGLPPIIPIVVQNVREGWTVPTRFAAIYDVPEAALAPIRTHVPDFEYIVDDLRGATEEALGARTESPYLRLALWSLRLRGDAPEPRRIATWIEDFRALRAADDSAGLESVLRYHAEVSEDRGSVLIDAVAKADPGVREALMSWYDRIVEEGRRKGREEGREKGREEGREEGRVEGRVEGELSVLSKQLQLKFGALPPATEDRLAHASPEQLERWAERVLTAATIDEVFAANGRDG
jgi:hypothetical protein